MKTYHAPFLRLNHIMVLNCFLISSLLLADSRPNIIFILTDDQRFDQIAAVGNFPWMETPNLDRLVQEGIHFRNAFVTTSLCGPSRASFLTGTYANKHGVVANEYIDYDKNLPTFATLLQESGYHTGYFGKWHQAMHNRPRPGFDKWMVFWGQGKYFNDTLMMEDGGTFTIPEGKYLTDQLNELSLEFIDNASKKDSPFLLYLSHKALHEPFTPPDRHKNLYANQIIPSQDDPRDDLLSKPEYIQSQALENRNRNGGLAAIHYKIPDKMRTATAVDEGVGKIFERLEEKNLLNNTIVIFAGDNGYFVSEHGGLHDKRKAYEESIRIPLLMWNPFVTQPQKIDAMVLNIDLAPFLCEIAGIIPPNHMHGESWQEILKGNSSGREGFLYEYYKETEYRPAGGFGGTPTLLAYRSKDWKYVTYPESSYKEELYNLAGDPNELFNLIDDPKFLKEKQSLQKQLKQILVKIDYEKPTKISKDHTLF